LGPFGRWVASLADLRPGKSPERSGLQLVFICREARP